MNTVKVLLCICVLQQKRQKCAFICENNYKSIISPWAMWAQHWHDRPSGNTDLSPNLKVQKWRPRQLCWYNFSWYIYLIYIAPGILYLIQTCLLYFCKCHWECMKHITHILTWEQLASCSLQQILLNLVSKSEQVGPQMASFPKVRSWLYLKNIHALFI